MISKTPKKNRNSVLHAWKQIDKARKLAGIDNEMSAFRAITAEEEVATAIIREIQDLGYENSRRLKPHDHSHKSGIWHLLTLISAFISEYNQLKATISEGTGELSGKLIISFPSLTPSDTHVAQLVPPLNFNITNKGERISFKKQANELASYISVNKLQKHLKNEANIRNELIYASPKGMPFVQIAPHKFIEERELRVMVLTYAYLLISQYREKQSFVQQCIDSYLTILSVKVDDSN